MNDFDSRYPEAESWQDRISFEGNLLWQLADQIHEHTMPWEQQKQLVHVYGFYFSDRVDLVRRVGSENIVWGYEADDPTDVEDEYFGLSVPHWHDHAERLTDASSTLIMRLGMHLPHFIFFMESDFILFRDTPITTAEQIEIKLITNLNLVDLSSHINLAVLFDEY